MKVCPKCHDKVLQEHFNNVYCPDKECGFSVVYTSDRERYIIAYWQYIHTFGMDEPIKVMVCEKESEYSSLQDVMFEKAEMQLKTGRNYFVIKKVFEL